MKCSKCKKYTPYHAFAEFTHRDGRIGKRSVCRVCRGEYATKNFERLKKYRKEYNKNNRTKKAIDTAKRRDEIKNIVNTIKQASPCKDCGGFFAAVAMDFDHIKRKNKSIANMVSQSYKIDLILEEIKLCEIVCACCHRVRTAKRKQNMGKKQ